MSKPKWKSQPKTNEWNNPTNWEPAEEPTNEAIFSKSAQTEIAFSPTSEAKVDTIEFTEEASPFILQIGIAAAQPALTIRKGVVNNSKNNQQFIVASNGVSYKQPQLKFEQEASAGGENISYAAGPSSLDKGFGGGIIGFSDKANAGSASFVVRTGAVPPPKNGSTVGAEVSFCDTSTAARANFKVYGTLGKDGDTFGNVVFHQHAHADHATFLSMGGTVSGGDGGNIQFYDNANAAQGVFINYGGTFNTANGGDTVFDGTAHGGHGHFYNRAAPAAGANGGVVSFNNNPPSMDGVGSSAGKGFYHNYGASGSDLGGGGHIEFSARYGCPTADHGTFNNYGSVIADNSSAGHTIFSINLPTEYFPTAGHGIFWNHPAVVKGAAAGHTEFSIYGTGKGGQMPNAGEATFYNLGGKVKGAAGGYTEFSGTTNAADAILIAFGGVHGGYGGRIVFYDNAEGGTASVQLFGNGELDISGHTNELTIGRLNLSGGIITVQLGANATNLTLSKALTINEGKAKFCFPTSGGKYDLDQKYTLLTSPDLSSFKESQFEWINLDGVKAVFKIEGDDLRVAFSKQS